MPRPQPKASLVGLKFVQTTAWPAVYREWFRQEGRRADWRRHLKARGFSDWPAWRQAVIVKPFGLAQRDWKVWRVTDPKAVLEWHGGPFPGWKKTYYAGAQTRSFRWLVKDGKIQSNRKVGKFKNLPASMTVFGLRYRNRIVIIDGMHRCCKLALALAQKKKVRTMLTLALADATSLPKLKPTQI